MTQTSIKGTLHERAVIRLSADSEDEDISHFLQGLVTQDMNIVKAQQPQWAALLSAQGKRLFDFFLWADGDNILIDCERNSVDALIKRLKLYRLRRKIEIAVDDRLNVHWAMDESGKPVDPRLDALGYRWLSEQKGESVDADYLAHRLQLGVTEGEKELGSDKVLWLECNARELNGVSFAKGCYVGQENTARMNYRQKVNRRMVVVPMAKADEKRQFNSYPALGLSVEHRRIENLVGLDLPSWLHSAVESQNT